MNRMLSMIYHFKNTVMVCRGRMKWLGLYYVRTSRVPPRLRTPSTSSQVGPSWTTSSACRPGDTSVATSAGSNVIIFWLALSLTCPFLSRDVCCCCVSFTTASFRQRWWWWWRRRRWWWNWWLFFSLFFLLFRFAEQLLSHLYTV